MRAAKDDEKKRLERQLGEQRWLTILTRMDGAREPIDSLVVAARLLTRSVLIVCGFYLHKGHEWRRRGRKTGG